MELNVALALLTLQLTVFYSDKVICNEMELNVALALLTLQLAVFYSDKVICNDLSNVALGKYTYQSSSEYSDEGGAELAVDGNTHQYWNGRSCTHTNGKSYGSYWEVDLGDIYVIESVEIYNRIDSCCNEELVGVEIYGGMTTATYNRIGYNAGTIYTTYKFEMAQTVRAKWIRVTRTPDIKAPMMLCEVEVMGYKPTSVPFRRVTDASGTGSSVATIFARTWEQCCHMCFTTAGCAAVELKDSLCTLLDSDAYEVTAGENIYKLD